MNTQPTYTRSGLGRTVSKLRRHNPRLNEALIFLGALRKTKSRRGRVGEMNDSQLWDLYELAHSRFKALMQQHHPDRGGDTESAAAVSIAWNRTRKLFQRRGIGVALCLLLTLSSSAELAMSPKVTSQQVRTVTSVQQPTITVTIRWNNPKTPFASNVLQVVPIAGGPMNWFASTPTNTAQVTAPSNSVRITAFTLAAIGLSLPSNTVTNAIYPAQLETNIYHVQPMFSPDLGAWTPQGQGWTFTNLSTSGSGFWRLLLTQ